MGSTIAQAEFESLVEGDIMSTCRMFLNNDRFGCAVVTGHNVEGYKAPQFYTRRQRVGNVSLGQGEEYYFECLYQLFRLAFTFSNRFCLMTSKGTRILKVMCESIYQC